MRQTRSTLSLQLFSPLFSLLRLCLCLATLLLVLPCLPESFADSPTRPTAASASNAPPALDPKYHLGSWIWAADTFDKQTCRLWKSFEIPRSAVVARALLHMTADNGYRLMLDGRQVGRGSDWRGLTEYDLTWLLFPGKHVLAVEGFNDRDAAGVILGMRIQYMDGSVQEIASDHMWRVVPESETNWEDRKQPRPAWPEAKVVGELGAHPWWSKPVTIAPVPPLMPVALKFWQTGWFQIALISLCVMVGLLCLRLMAKLALQSRAQRLLQLERARIARDIHDDLGAGLTQLVVLGEVAQSDLEKDSATRAQINRLCEKARDVSRSMDEIVWAVNSKRDTLRDFVSYVCKHAQSYLQSTPIRCRLDLETELPPIPFDLPIRRNLFLAVKEALNNAAKHSEADELFLRIHRLGDGLRVVVEDNGKGFDPALANPERNGLSNMEHRMKEVTGTFLVTSKPGRGCRFEFAIPSLQAQRRATWFKRLFRARRHEEFPEVKSAEPRRPSGVPVPNKSAI